jgi:hypothetical protein
LDEPLDNLLLLGTIGIVAEDIFKAFQRLTGHEYKSQCSVIENAAVTACSIRPYTRKTGDRELLFFSTANTRRELATSSQLIEYATKCTNGSSFPVSILAKVMVSRSRMLSPVDA